MSSPPDSERRKQRDAALRTQDQVIADHLAQAYKSGELQSAESFGKPLQEPTGWSQTPEAFRLPFKILKNAGITPPEVDLFRRRAELRRQIDECTSDVERTILLQKLSELEQLLALRLEGMRSSGSL